MSKLETIKSAVGLRGTVVIAAAFRKRYGLAEGAEILQEPTPEGVFVISF